MKICHVIYIPRFSGAEILVRNLAIEHQAEGHEIGIVAILPPEASFAEVQRELESMGIWINFPKTALNQWQRVGFLAQALKQFSPDVIFAHAVIPSFYARFAVKWANLRSTAVVSVLHDASQDDYASAYFRSVEKWLAPVPAAIVAVSPAGAKNYLQRIGRRLNPQVIANGIQLEAFTQPPTNRASIRQEIFKVDAEEVVCLQVGRISTVKQQHYSLEAFAIAIQQLNLPGKLCFVGLSQDQAYESELKQRAKQLEIADRVVFLGARSDIPDLLAAADLYLMPSRFEAHSVAFIEALASGISIIASDIDSFQFGTKFPGVTLITLNQIETYVSAIEQVLRSRTVQRWQRDLSAYSIHKTADSYLALSNALVSHAL